MQLLFTFFLYLSTEITYDENRMLFNEIFVILGLVSVG